MNGQYELMATVILALITLALAIGVLVAEESGRRLRLFLLMLLSFIVMMLGSFCFLFVRTIIVIWIESFFE